MDGGQQHHHPLLWMDNVRPIETSDMGGKGTGGVFMMVLVSWGARVVRISGIDGEGKLGEDLSFFFINL